VPYGDGASSGSQRAGRGGASPRFGRCAFSNFTVEGGNAATGRFRDDKVGQVRQGWNGETTYQIRQHYARVHGHVIWGGLLFVGAWLGVCRAFRNQPSGNDASFSRSIGLFIPANVGDSDSETWWTPAPLRGPEGSSSCAVTFDSQRRSVRITIRRVQNRSTKSKVRGFPGVSARTGTFPVSPVVPVPEHVLWDGFGGGGRQVAG